MRKSIFLPALFLVMLLAQWYVPVSMISGSQQVIEKGTLHRFKCAPVDPNDPFRGKYITLRYDANSCSVPKDLKLYNGQKVYVRFTQDSAGFAKIQNVSPTKPNDLSDVLVTEVDYVLKEDQGGQKVFIVLPFTRFYLEEFAAPKAEAMYNDAVGDTMGNTYGLVYLLNGEARIKDVVIRDTSILERLGRLEN